MEELLAKFKALSLEDMLKIKKEASKIIKERMTTIDIIDMLKQVETQGCVISIKNLELDSKINLYFNVYVTTVSDDVNSVEVTEEQPEWINYFPVVLTDFVNDYPDLDDVVQVDKRSPTVPPSASASLSNPFVSATKKIGKLPVYLYHKVSKDYPNKVSFKVITKLGEVRTYFIVNSEVYTDQKQIFDTVTVPTKLNSVYIIEG